MNLATYFQTLQWIIGKMERIAEKSDLQLLKIIRGKLATGAHQPELTIIYKLKACVWFIKAVVPARVTSLVALNN